MMEDLGCAYLRDSAAMQKLLRETRLPHKEWIAA